jgi:molybdenum-dependent DNA-binding transcriptional regulator ModE
VDELYHLIKMIKELKLINKVAQELGIKPSSVRRQINRIEAYIEERPVQKRSGKQKGQEYAQAMRKVLERELGRPIRTETIPTDRRVVFQKLEDALRYSKPIAHISNIRKVRRKRRKEDKDEWEEWWEIEIARDSGPWVAGGY